MPTVELRAMPENTQKENLEKEILRLLHIQQRSDENWTHKDDGFGPPHNNMYRPHELRELIRDKVRAYITLQQSKP